MPTPLGDDVEIRFRPMDEPSARTILKWRYEPPYDLYNPDSKELEADLALFLAPENSYYSLLDGNSNLIGYCCFGKEAQVLGGDYQGEALDVGLGLRPDLTGKGHGASILSAVVEFAHGKFHTGRLRATVASFNQRALRACKRAGFTHAGEFVRPSDNRRFVILVCD